MVILARIRGSFGFYAGHRCANAAHAGQVHALLRNLEIPQTNFSKVNFEDFDIEIFHGAIFLALKKVL